MSYCHQVIEFGGLIIQLFMFPKYMIQKSFKFEYLYLNHINKQEIRETCYTIMI